VTKEDADSRKDIVEDGALGLSLPLFSGAYINLHVIIY
jgi:hypothetical protein